MSDNNEKVKKTIYKKWWFWLIIVIVIIALSGSSEDVNTTNNAYNDANNTNTNISNTISNNQDEKIEYLIVDVDELNTALENNAAAAKDKYNGKYLEITGKLGTIDSNLKYISLLSSTDEWDIIGILCSVKNDEQKNIIKTLNKDQIITIRGKITDVGEVMGYNLDIIEIIK